jgi:energy-coupling factor transporter ATP-binding protein EcfA2
MSFHFRKAVREQSHVLISLAGPTGSGKTKSALRLARGLVGPKGRIAVIDTEAGRALHYADEHEFDHGELVAPFRPAAYQAAIESAEKDGYGAVIIDSLSHEYEGVGGLIEWADECLAAGAKSPANWKEPKMAHRKMMNRLLQMRCHLIFCLRAEEKMLMKKEGGKTIIVPASDRPLIERWHPICEKRFMYEMTASFLLLGSAPGVPIPVKLEGKHAPFFAKNSVLDEAAGEKLAAWADGAPASGSNKAKPTEREPSAVPNGGQAVPNEAQPADPAPPKAAEPAKEVPEDVKALAKELGLKIQNANKKDALGAIWDLAVIAREKIKAASPKAIAELERRYNEKMKTL